MDIFFEKFKTIMVNFPKMKSRPVTLLSVLVLQGEGAGAGSIANGISGSIVEIRERGVGDFIS